MHTLTRFGIQRLCLGWVIFFAGWMLILWLHTFSDTVPHRFISPILLLLWIALVVCVWDGCKMFTPRFRFVLFAIQVVTAVAVCMSFVHHILYHSL
jgi:hypothetical protein